MDKKQRDEFDRRLAVPDREPTPVPGKPRQKKPPAWWHGEEAAAREAQGVIQFLGQRDGPR